MGSRCLCGAGISAKLVRGADHFVPVPDGLDDGETVALILNYGKIKPVIAHRLPLLAVRRSQELLEAGGITARSSCCVRLDCPEHASLCPRRRPNTRRIAGL